MNEKIPRTPFSTSLSRSAKETEIRLKNIFSGPKKRPPVLFLALMCLIALSCGDLVSCQRRPAEPTLVMATQYYDSYANYLEIPMLALPAGEENEAVEAINAGLARLGEKYEYLNINEGPSQQCILYPSTTDRYLNLVLFEYPGSSGTDGDIQTWVYDKKEGTQVTGEEALALADTSLEALSSQLEETIANDPEDSRGLYPDTPDPIVLLGFRIKADGRPVFYLSAYVDGRELENGGYYEWARLYEWDEGEFSRYSCMVFGSAEQYPLVPAEETDQLDPPLWNQWYFAGEEPEGGFVSRYVPGTDPYGTNYHTAVDLYVALFDCYAAYQDEWNLCYSDYAQGTEEDGDLRIGPAVCLGEIPWGEDSYAAAYQICYTFYIDGPRGLEWHANFEDIVLRRSAQDGSFTGLLGRADYDYRMEDMTAEELIEQIAAG